MLKKIFFKLKKDSMDVLLFFYASEIYYFFPD